MKMKIVFSILLVGCVAVFASAQNEMLSLTLEEYVKRAQELGKDARLNEYSFQQAGYSRDIGYRGLDAPRVNLAATASRSQTKTGDSTSTTEAQNTSVTVDQPFLTGTNLALRADRDQDADTTLKASVTQPIYFFVKNSALRSRLRTTFSFQSAQDTFESQNLAIRANARAFYFDVLEAEEQIKVDERKLESSRKLVEITQALVQGGQKAAVEMMRAKLKMQTDERSVQNTVLKRDQAVLKAKDYIALSFDQPIRLISKIPFAPFKRSLVELVDYAMVHEPGLRSLRRSKELAQISLQETREAQRPKLSVNGSYDYADASSSISKGWTVGGSLQWLLFDSFVTSKQVQSARISLLVAEINYSEGERRLRQNIESDYLNLKKSEQQIREFQTTREQAKRNLEVIRLRFQNGLEKLIDVFDAESDLRNLEKEYLALLISFNKSKDSLSRLIGGDVETLP